MDDGAPPLAVIGSIDDWPWIRLVVGKPTLGEVYRAHRPLPDGADPAIKDDPRLEKTGLAAGVMAKELTAEGLHSEDEEDATADVAADDDKDAEEADVEEDADDDDEADDAFGSDGSGGA